MTSFYGHPFLTTNRKKFYFESLLCYVTFIAITTCCIHFGSKTVLANMNSVAETPQLFEELRALDSLSEEQFEELKELEHSIVNDREASSKRFKAYTQGYAILTLLFALSSFIFWYFLGSRGNPLITASVTFVVVLVTSGGLLMTAVWAVLSVSAHYFSPSIKSRK